MDLFQIILITATFLCSLVGGFLFAFAIVVMPGIKGLNDAEFIRAFQLMDRIIQNGQPLFMVVWAGSAIALIITAVMGIGELNSPWLAVLIFAVLIYLLGVQLPTGLVNVPLNNKLQIYEVSAMTETDQRAARENFEGRWNRWNILRTVLSILTSLILMIVLLFY